MSPTRTPTRPASRRRKLPVGLIAGLVILLLLGAWVLWDQTRVYPTPERTSGGYAPQVGDVVFQSLPRGELVDLIEGATGSPLSHCGIVALSRGRWVVVEAIGPVKETLLEPWIKRGRGQRLWAYRLDASKHASIPAFVEASRDYLGRPYDMRYRMDDEEIYCSELVQKSYERIFHEPLGPLVKLRDLEWESYRSTIERLEPGDPPLDRLLITPRDLAKSSALRLVFGPLGPLGE